LQTELVTKRGVTYISTIVPTTTALISIVALAI